MNIDDVKILNPTFNFDNYELTNGVVFREKFYNYCLCSKQGVFHRIWLDKEGYIIQDSLKYAELIISNHKKIKDITSQIKNEMCNSMDKNKYWTDIWSMWDKKLRSVNQKKKGLRRMLIRRDKYYNENGGSRNKIDSLCKYSIN